MRSALTGVQPEAVLNFLGYDLPEVKADYELFRGVVRQYIFISSTVIYAKPPRQLPLTEDAPTGNPWWDYAQKKLACEQWLQERRAETGFPVTIVRPSHTYSKRWIPNPVSSGSYTFAARLEQGKQVFVHDAGESPWTLTAASDFAAVLTWNQIYAEIAAALGAPSPQIVNVPTDFICQVAPQLTGTLKGDKAHPGVFDNSKIKRFVPGLQCRVPFRVRVRESVRWLREHPDQQNRKPELDGLIEGVVGAWLKSESRRAGG